MYRRSILQDRDELVKEVMEAYRDILREAHMAWIRSIGISRKRVIERSLPYRVGKKVDQVTSDGDVISPREDQGDGEGTDDLKTTRVTEMEEERVGDPQYLQLARSVLKDICELRGLMPSKKEVQGAKPFDWDAAIDKLSDGDVVDVVEVELQDKIESLPKLIPIQNGATNGHPTNGESHDR